VVGLGAQITGGSIGPVPATFCGVGAAVALLLLSHWVLGSRRKQEVALATVAADEGVS